MLFKTAFAANVMGLRSFTRHFSGSAVRSSLPLVTFAGRLGSINPGIGKDGRRYVRYSIAMSRSFPKKENGEITIVNGYKVYETAWFTIFCHQPGQCERVEKLNVGSLVHVQAELDKKPLKSWAGELSPSLTEPVFRQISLQVIQNNRGSTQ